VHLLNWAALSLAAFFLPFNVVVALPASQSTSQIIRTLPNDPTLPYNEDSAPIHRANFLEQFFGGGQQPRPQYAPGGGQIRRDLPPPPPPSQRQVSNPVAINGPEAPTEPAIIFSHESMKDPNDWKVKYFDVVVVINKSRTGQNIFVYSKADGEMPSLVMNKVRVSTGRETPELSNIDREAAGLEPAEIAPKTSYFSNTPTGYFTPTRFSIDHVSKDWELANMDHAVFFHPRGIATHGAPSGTEAKLGRPVSGGCVRLKSEDAYHLFWLIRGTGGPVTAAELAGGNFERSAPGPSFANELRAQLANGFSTYERKPNIPVFDRTGKVTFAVDRNGQVLVDSEGQPIPSMREAEARTLIVVENRELLRTSKPRR
jgi:lipoprotein-anchoring transpeptidase ErfK/SrfK